MAETTYPLSCMQVKSEIIKHMRRASVSDLRDVLLMASVVAIVTEKRDELSEETQVKSCLSREISLLL